MSTSRLLRTLCLVTLFTPFWISDTKSHEIVGSSTLSPDDLEASDHFGFSSATDGKWLLIGSKYSQQAGFRVGAVYIYRYCNTNKNWVLYQKITPNNGIDGGQFGESVALRDNQLVIGSRFSPSATGATSGTAYVYRYRGSHFGWVFEQELEPPDGRDKDEFGRSVAITKKHLMVGARFAANNEGEATGAVYTYTYNKCKNSWNFIEKILDQKGEANDQFGRSIVFSRQRVGILAIASRKGSTTEINNCGKVLLYRYGGNGWELFQVLSGKDSSKGDYFGQSLAMEGNTLVVGARNAKNATGQKAGAAYIFTYNHKFQQYIPSQKLLAPDGNDKAQFGFATTLANRRSKHLAISARRADSSHGKKTGKVYLYSYKRKAKAYALDQVLAPSSLQPDNEFGQSLAMSPHGEKWLTVGADQSTLSGAEKAGMVYFFKMKK